MIVSRYEILFLRVDAMLTGMVLAGSEPMFYTHFARALGNYRPNNRYLCEALDQTVTNDCKAGKPIRSSLIVRMDTGEPGEGLYISAARELKMVRGDDASWVRFWKEQIRLLKAERKAVDA